MSSGLFALLVPVGISSYVVAGIAAALFIFGVVSRPSKVGEFHMLDAIPTFGSRTWIGSWWAGLKYQTNGAEVIRKGYEKYKSAPFKVSAFCQWLVLVNSREHVEELYKAHSDTLSFAAAGHDRLQFDHTLGPQIYRNKYHVPIVRSRLTRNLGVLYSEIRDEVIAAFDDILDLRGNEWKSILALRSMRQVVCRTSNRVFVGRPLCRDPDWIDLNICYSIEIGRGSATISLFPDLLKPIATRLFTNIYQGKQRAVKLLGPVIERRRKCLDEHGNDWADKPNDFLSWLMEVAEGPELTTEYLTTRIQLINAGSILNTSTGFTHTLFCLAANPQFIQPLREEVESAIEIDGWSRDALGKMHKVDSFIKECQRFVDHNCVSLQRKVLKDYTFSDGTFVPKGTLVATATCSKHHNEAFYEHPLAFEPFRFVHSREEYDEGFQDQCVSTTPEYLTFGHGRQACPGRFFAGNELKSLLAHVVVTYDVKLEDGMTWPKPLPFVTLILPDPSVKVMFRRRIE